MTQLSVNLNKIALLRNQRDLSYPCITTAAQTCIEAGCHGITVHPRPDERHIRQSDVYELAEMLTVEFNIEGNPTPAFMDLVREVRPTQCTLVPDTPDQRTSDHGWNLEQDGDRIAEIVAELSALGIRSSLFLDPNEKDVELAKATGTDRIELYTEPFASAFDHRPANSARDYADAATLAYGLGLGVNAGHDLSLHNLPHFLKHVPYISEVSIGHALIADAVFEGLGTAVMRYVRVLKA